MDGDWQENYPDYLGCCASLDENVGRIREELAKMDADENTVIIYTSDHGSHFKTRNSEYKRCCHDGCIRVPLIIHGPGFTSGKVISEMVSLIDLPRSVLEIGGAEKPTSMKGQAVQRLLKGDTEDWPEEVFVQISESQVGRAIRTKKWKYSVQAPNKDGNMDSASDVYVEDFLYDLENDPHERDNLVRHPKYVNVRCELAERLKKRMAEAGEKIPTIITKGESTQYNLVEL